MSLVLHLMRHDVRTHRALVTTWGALVLAHTPLGLIAATGALAPDTWPAMAWLIACRVVMAAVTIAAIVHDDAPGDECAFWSTRPISAATMAAAKGALVAVLFLLFPLAIVLATAIGLGIPLAHVPSIVGQVLALDGLVVGVMLVVATLTRRLSSALIALVAMTLGLAVLAGIATSALPAAPLRDGVLGLARAAPEESWPMLGLVASTALWGMATLAWRRRPRRRSMAVTAMVGISACVLVVTNAVLDARAGAPLVRGVRVQLTRDYVAWGTGDHTTVGAGIDVPGWDADDAGMIRFDGRVSADAAWRREVKGETRQVRRGEHVALPLVALSASELRGLAGRSLRVTGTVRIARERPRLLGTLATQPGASLRVPGLDLRILEGPGAYTHRLGLMSVRWTTRRLGDFHWSGAEVFIRAPGSDLRRLAVTPQYVQWYLDSAMLPTLARPFGFRHVTLDGLYPPDSSVTRAVAEHAVLEVRGPMQMETTQHEVDGTLTIPAEAAADPRAPRSR